MKGYILLIFCAVIMVSLMQFRRKLYRVSFYRSLVITVYASLTGFFSTYVMYYLENWEWGGQSFFGAVLFFPIVLFPISHMLQIPLNALLDYATPAGLALLIPFRLNCYLGGCCGGKVMWFSEDGIPTFFPSQLVEMTIALLLTIFLLVSEHNPKWKGRIYPLCLIAYGSTRFVLNYFRWEQSDFIFGMPAGNFWALLSFVIGVVWLFVSSRQKEEKS